MKEYPNEKEYEHNEKKDTHKQESITDFIKPKILKPSNIAGQTKVITSKNNTSLIEKPSTPESSKILHESSLSVHESTASNTSLQNIIAYKYETEDAKILTNPLLSDSKIKSQVQLSSFPIFSIKY